MAEFTQTTTIKVDCPACGNDGVIKHGFHSGVQRYQCKACRKVFRGSDKAQGRSYTPKTIGSAVDAFYDGLSYRRIAQNVGQAEGIDTPSSFTPYDWVKDYTARAQDLLDGAKPKTGDEWVVDELAIDVGGRKVWLWNVMDADTRFVLATHISNTRGQGNAATLLRKAKAAAGNLPEQVKTDRLPAYGPAMFKVFGQNNVKHIRSDGIRAEVNNNLSERLQGTFRGRTKTMRGLEGDDSAQEFLDGWALDYNYFRPHMALDGKTPAAAAGIDAPVKSWQEVAAAAVPRAKPRSETITIRKNTLMEPPPPTRARARASGERKRSVKPAKPAKPPKQDKAFQHPFYRSSGMRRGKRKRR